jgi:hypothetical protein
MQSAGGSSTMLAYHTTLGESRGARDHDTARLVHEVTKYNSAAKKAAIEALKAHIRKDFEVFRRTQPSDALAVMRYPLSQSTPSVLYWVDYHKKQQWMNAPDLNVWFRAEMTPDPHRRGGGDALQREEEEEEKNRNGTQQQILSAGGGGRRLTPKERAVMATMGFGSSSNAASSSSMMMSGVGGGAAAEEDDDGEEEEEEDEEDEEEEEGGSRTLTTTISGKKKRRTSNNSSSGGGITNCYHNY